MESAFAGLSTALSALYAQKRGLDVTGQNIANASTDGYSRQRVDLRPTGGSTSGAIFAVDRGSVGGVEVAGVQRITDELAASRARTEHAADGYLQGQKTAYGEIEQIYGEPGDTGIQSQLGKFWTSLHNLANNPGDLATRSTVLQQAAVVTDGLRAASAGLGSMWRAGRDQVAGTTTEINTTAAAVADLNQAILRAQGSGNPANELADQRDLKVARLVELTGATAAGRDDGTVDVTLGGSLLVAGKINRTLVAAGASDPAGLATDPVGVRWADTQQPVPVASGVLASDLQTLNTILPAQIARLDDVAASLIAVVNGQHAAGYDRAGAPGGALLSGTDAASIAVAITDPQALAAAGTQGAALDGANADAMAGLSGLSAGPDSRYRQLIADLGVQSQSAQRRAGIQTTVTQQADAAQSAQSGVNLDEEMANMMQFQRAYEAASRVFTTIDSVLNTLINHTGIG